MIAERTWIRQNFRSLSVFPCTPINSRYIFIPCTSTYSYVSGQTVCFVCSSCPGSVFVCLFVCLCVHVVTVVLPVKVVFAVRQRLELCVRTYVVPVADGLSTITAICVRFDRTESVLCKSLGVCGGKQHERECRGRRGRRKPWDGREKTVLGGLHRSPVAQHVAR